MFSNYKTGHLCIFLYSCGTLLQMTSGKPVDFNLIDQSKHDHAPSTKVLKHKKRSLDRAFPTQRLKEWERNLHNAAKVAGESSSAKEEQPTEQTFIDQTKQENMWVAEFSDPEGRRLNDAIPSQQLRLRKSNLGHAVKVAGKSWSKEHVKPLEFSLTDQSQRDIRPVIKLLDQKTSSLRLAAPREQITLSQRDLADGAKLAGGAWSAKDGGKRLKQHHNVNKAQKTWRETHKHGCTPMDESCIEITNEGSITYSK